MGADAIKNTAEILKGVNLTQLVTGNLYEKMLLTLFTHTTTW